MPVQFQGQGVSSIGNQRVYIYIIELIIDNGLKNRPTLVETYSLSVAKKKNSFKYGDFSNFSLRKSLYEP